MATKKRLTKTERNARDFCEMVRENGSADFGMVWKKSRTWGQCPSITGRGVIIARASGCGYDKESACLVEALQFLATTDDERRTVWGASGAGFPSVVKALASIGWGLTQTYSGQAEDGYRVEVLAPAES